MENSNIIESLKCLEEVKNMLLIESLCARSSQDQQELIRKITDVLSKPKRNCDCFGGDPKKLHKAWWEWSGDWKNCNPDGTVKLTYGEWLLANAE